VKLPSLVFEIWRSQGFWGAQTHSLTYSLTDRPDYRMLLHKIADLKMVDQVNKVKIQSVCSNFPVANIIPTLY